VFVVKVLSFYISYCTNVSCVTFYAPQLVQPGTAEARISYGNSVRLSVRLSRPGGIPSTGEIETPGLHHMVAWSI